MPRAAHLEMVYSLDTDSFLKPYDQSHRFTARSYVGLKELISKLDKSKIEKSPAYIGIKCHFNPPLRPHFSGVHGTMIKAAKRAIYGTVSQADITDEELSPAFTCADDLISSRPLTY